ncbi:DNA repair protein [Lactobacillus amylovorus]|jgi:predicted HicB family RNase H-like nuclease|uniref:DNA repair protein n=1 Tax=Lactobacillus amylovorus TaxID=1604 RepID=UPI003F89AE3F
MKMLHYKDYYGTVNISEEDNVLYGKVSGIKGLSSYEGETVEELKQGFHNVVDEYIVDCKRNNIKLQVFIKVRLMCVSLRNCIRI